QSHQLQEGSPGPETARRRVPRWSVAAAAALLLFAGAATLWRPRAGPAPEPQGAAAARLLPAEQAPLDLRKQPDIPAELLSLVGGEPGRLPAELVAVLARPRLQHAKMLEGMEFVDDGAALVAADWTGGLSWWEPQSGKLLRRLPNVHAKWIRGLALSPDGK